MPPVFPSGQFPPGACGQVRPVGATLPTAARRAPSREAADGYTCPQARAASPQGNTSLQDRRVLPQGQAAATPAWTGGVDRWRGGMQDFDLNGGSDAGHILQPQKTGMSCMAFPRTPANTKKSLRTISRLKTLSKHGGFLLSHLIWQYHRR